MTTDVVRSVLVSRDPEVHSGDTVVRREQAIAALEILREALLAK